MQGYDFFDLEKPHGLMWMRGWRCGTCGYAANPIAEANRRLGLVDKALRVATSGPTSSMLSLSWRYER